LNKPHKPGIIQCMSKDLFSAIHDGNAIPAYKYFDGKEWKSSLSGKTIDIISPVTGEVLGKIQAVTHSEADKAIMRAKEAQKEWAHKTLTEREKILELAADWMREHEPFLTKALILEIGKTEKDAKDEVLRSADMIEYFAREAGNLHGNELRGGAYPGYDDSKICMVERVPLGVILAIGPFNYPINLSISKIAPALVTGNAVVFKPPTQGSIVGLHITEIFRKAGLPEGLLVTVTGGGGDIGDYLTTHPKIDMITYTGSSEIGKRIAAQVGLIPMLFECGGNNPAIVLQDANIDQTVDEIVKGAFSYAGQRCTAIKYVLGLDPQLNEIVPKVVEKTKKMIKTGDPRESTHTMGPVINDRSAEEIETRIMKAKADGARLMLGGDRNGRYLEPTILDNVRMSMDVVATETFGPVVCFVRVKNIDEAVKIVNDSQYGLQVSIFTKDEGVGIRIGSHINTGTVQLNNRPQRGPDHFPFMGVKDSGMGAQGIRYALEASTRLKSIVLNKPQ
jgi:glyceraldehyde-3-phosphate dehydrogenase (NADP+)